MEDTQDPKPSTLGEKLAAQSEARKATTGTVGSLQGIGTNGVDNGPVTPPPFYNDSPFSQSPLSPSPVQPALISLSHVLFKSAKLNFGASLSSGIIRFRDGYAQTDNARDIAELDREATHFGIKRV